MSASVSLILGGQPSTIQPTERPWDSPQLERLSFIDIGVEEPYVETLNNSPKKDMLSTVLLFSQPDLMQETSYDAPPSSSLQSHVSKNALSETAGAFCSTPIKVPCLSSVLSTFNMHATHM